MPEWIVQVLAFLSPLMVGVNIFQFLAFKSQLQKERALAGQEAGKSTQENAKGKQEEVTVLNNLNDVFLKVSETFKKEFSDMQLKIEDLEEKLNGYVKQCTECPNNKMQKKK